MAIFDPAYTWAIPHEDYDLSGAITPEPNGGWARYGINSIANPDIDLKTLTPAGGKQRMKQKYWDHFRLGEIKSQKVASKAFDMIINCEYNGAKILQRAVGANPDGGIGDETLALVNKIPAATLIPLLCAKQAEHYQEEYEAAKKKGQNYPLASLQARAKLIPPQDA